MEIMRFSSFARSDVVSSISSPSLLLTWKPATRSSSSRIVRVSVRGIGKALNELRQDRIRSLFRARRAQHRISVFGRKPQTQHTPQLDQTSQEKTEAQESSLSPQENSQSVQREEKKFGANIPWGKAKIVEVMALWFCSFVAFRSGIWKLGMWVLGIASEAELSASGQAAFTLGLDFSMLGATIFILHKCLQKYEPLRKRGLFPMSFKGKWWIIVLLSCICIPLVDWLGTRMTVWFPEDIESTTSNVVVQLSRGDLLTTLLYFILLSMCAPIWEEVMFRGFLLPSLGKFLPSALAIFASAAIFALMHGNLRQFVPLWLLGVIIAFTIAMSLFMCCVDSRKISK